VGLGRVREPLKGFAAGGPQGDIPPVDATSTAGSDEGPGPATSGAIIGAIWIAAVGASLAAVTYRAFDLDRFFVPKELALHAGALIDVVALAARRGTRNTSRSDVALAAWLALSFVSALFATSGWHAGRALSLSASAAALFWGARALCDSNGARRAVIAIGAAVTFAAASSLAQAYGISFDVFATNRAPGGTLGNRNFIAHVAAMGLPLLLWLSATARSSARALLGAFAILILSAALVLSRTRAAWLALAVWGVVALPLAWRGRSTIAAALAPRRGPLLIAALAAGAVLALILPNALDWRSDSPYLDSMRGVVNYREGSGAGRVKQYLNSLKLVRRHPVLGVGPGNWAAEYPAVVARSDPSLIEATGMTANPWPSSDWIAALAERGVPAAVALAAFVLLLLAGAWRSWTDIGLSAGARLGALAGGSVVLIGAVEGSFDAVALLAFPSIILWGSAGALIPRGQVIGERRITRRARGYLTGAVAIAWCAIVATSVAKLHAMRLYSTGTYDSVREAASYDPGSYRIQLRAAEVQAARGYCRLAYHNAMRAVSLFPHAAAAQAILARCANSDRD
jgi:O-antigen ligase